LEKCPTCNANIIGKRRCHRCKTDLSPLLNIEASARDHLGKARKAFEAEDYPNMFLHARRAFSLRQTSDAYRMLACAALITGRYHTAVRLWKGLRLL
jgi:hypothetical protein